MAGTGNRQRSRGHSRTRIVALDHLGAPVRDIKAARAFYGAALGAIGMKINMDVTSAFGMGSGSQKIFWLSGHNGQHRQTRQQRGD